MQPKYQLDNYDILLDEEPQFSVKEYVLKIRDLPQEDKPREKMSKYGPRALSVSELIAILLNTGTTKEDVMNMSARIIREYGERALAVETDPLALARELAIPQTKAFQIVACAELGRRFFERKPHGLATIRTAQDVFDYLPEMRSLPKEHMRGIYLNTHHCVIHDEVLSIGTINSNLIHPRELFKPAIEYGAAAVILAHNHPSGIVTPSKADIEITNHLIKVGKLIGIPLVDHVIIGRTTYTSIQADY